MKRIVLALLVASACLGCTQNQRARSLGGTAKITVPSNRKLVNLTWKQDGLWVLTRERKPGETPEVYFFEENSSYGLIEGSVVVTELP